MAKRKVLSRPLPDASLPRNSFDRGFTSAYTSVCGQLLPVFCQPVIAGSHSKINRRIFQRTANVHTAAFATLDTHIQFYFVPLRMLMGNWDSFKLNIQDINSSAYAISKAGGVKVGGVPYFNLKGLNSVYPDTASYNDDCGFRLWKGALRLLDMLGYGNYTSLPDGDYRSLQLNAFRLLAYQKVYYDHFRNTAYESNDPFAYNADFHILNDAGDVSDSLPQILRMRYVNYRKDFFQNLYPSLDYVVSSPEGTNWSIPKSVVDDNHSAAVTFDGSVVGETESDTDKWKFSAEESSPGSSRQPVLMYKSSDGLKSLLSTDSDSSPSWLMHTHDVFGDAEVPATQLLSVLNAQTIRATFALDKLMRSSAYAPKHAKEQYEARYGIKFPENINESTFIGAFKNDVVIGEVVNQTAFAQGDTPSGAPLGAIGGKGVGAGNFGQDIVYDNKEDGFIIGVQYSLPRTSYDSTRIDTYNLKSDREDFFIPEFMDLGLQPITRREMRIQDSLTKDNYILGYVPRYQEYKLGIDENHGLFATDSDLSKFVVDSGSKMASAVVDGNGVTARFFKVSPSDVDSIFQVNFDGSQSTDQFLNYCHFKFDCVMNMSVHGQPRL